MKLLNYSKCATNINYFNSIIFQFIEDQSLDLQVSLNFMLMMHTF